MGALTHTKTFLFNQVEVSLRLKSLFQERPGQKGSIEQTINLVLCKQIHLDKIKTVLRIIQKVQCPMFTHKSFSNEPKPSNEISSDQTKGTTPLVKQSLQSQFLVSALIECYDVSTTQLPSSTNLKQKLNRCCLGGVPVCFLALSFHLLRFGKRATQCSELKVTSSLISAHTELKISETTALGLFCTVAMLIGS